MLNPRDLAFVLFEVLDAATLVGRPRFAEHTRETFEAVLEAARRLAEERFAPHNRKSDEHEPTWDGARVTVIPEVGEALAAFAEAGFMSAHADHEQGGLQLPVTIAQAAMAHFMAANVATSAYAFLTIAAGNLIAAFGTPEQKRLFLAPMLAGRYFGTMALTEPQAGSSLADIRTRAEKQPDGSFHLTSTKIYISGGDHEIAENIVHMVLAKIKGTPDDPTPPGVKGISLFLVPKHLVGDDGGKTTRNGVALAGLIHKMGYRGTVSTILNFGESGPCVGYLVGERHQGLAAMFQMMNEARISVGLGAAMLGYAGYRASLDYARGRTQGRLPSAKGADQKPVRLVDHADIRRMLLAQKAYAEGGLALCLLGARLVDDEKTAPDPADRRRASRLLDLLIPIVKAWPSDYGIEANHLAIQVLGGYGYTRDYPVEQFLRDNRLNPIHEGTNGIQGIDLLGRKVRLDDGAALSALAEAIGQTVTDAEPHADLAEHRAALRAALDDAIATTRVLVEAIAGDADRGLAQATLYLDMMGRVVMAWIWLRQAVAAEIGLASTSVDAERDFYRGKMQAACWYLRHELPKAHGQCALLRSGDATAFDMQDLWF